MTTGDIIALVSVIGFIIVSAVVGVWAVSRELRALAAEQATKRHDLRGEVTVMHTKLEFRVDRLEQNTVEKAEFNQLMSKLDLIIEQKQTHAVAMMEVKTEMKHLANSVNALNAKGCD